MNQDMKAVAPHAAVDARWLLYTLQSQEQVILHACRKAGTTVASLDTTKLHGLPIPLPPLPEQRRIVEVLEDHLSRLDAADASVHSAVARISNLTSSSHVSALSRTTNADSIRIGEIAKIGSGATPLRGKAQYYDGGTIPWATSGDLHAGDIVDVRGRITEAALQETAVKLWPAGTLLVAMYGEGKTRGTVAELHIASTTNQACAAIVLHPEFTGLKRWVRFILRTRYDEMRAQASGGVQPNLSLGRIREISIPMPDVEVRNAILIEDEASSESVNRLRLAGEQSLARSTALRHSLLHTAFNGELVDQDPTDEPADVALAKFRAAPISRRQKTPATA
jgi:type I restriction enzyme S subunit